MIPASPSPHNGFPSTGVVEMIVIPVAYLPKTRAKIVSTCFK